MELVINTSYGGISDSSAAKRLNPQFIEDVKSGRFVGEGDDVWGYAETLKVISIPDEATDYMIVNYDGAEGVIFCIDGELAYVGSPETECIFNKE